MADIEMTAAVTTDWIVPLASALGGGIVGAGGALGAGWLTQSRADKRHRRSQQDSINSAKAERLRAIYEPLVSASLLLREVTHASGFTLTGETGEVRDERHNRQITEAFERCSKVAGRLTIEPKTQSVSTGFNSLVDSFRAYFTMLEVQRGAPGTYTGQELQAAVKIIESAFGNVLDRARAQLTDLETPTTKA